MGGNKATEMNVHTILVAVAGLVLATTVAATAEPVTDCLAVTGDGAHKYLDIKVIDCPDKLTVRAWPSRPWFKGAPPSVSYAPTPREQPGKPLDLSRFRN